MSAYCPAFKCRNCGGSWSANYRAVRYMGEEEPTQIGRINAAHSRYCAGPVRKMTAKEIHAWVDEQRKAVS